MAHRIITQIVLIGSRVMGRAVAEAWRQAQASAKYQKAAQAAGGSGATISGRGGIPLDESYKVLNIKPGTETEVMMERYKKLFETNDPKKGGSFYLQSKIYRARERIEAELRAKGKVPAEAEKSAGEP